MKNVLVVSLVMIATFCVAGESVTVGTNSVVVLPKRNTKPAAWVGATNSYAVSEYVRNGANRYIVTVAGTATNNAPTHQAGVVAYDGVSYRYIKPGKRQGAFIVNDSTNVVYLATDGETAVANTGIRLNASGGAATIAYDDNAEVTAISAVAGSNVTIQDR